MRRAPLGVWLAIPGGIALAVGLWLALPRSVDARQQLLPDVGGPIVLAAATAASARHSPLRSAGLVSELGRTLPARIELLLLTNDRAAFTVRGAGERRLRFVELPAGDPLTIWPQDPFLVVQQATGEPALLASRDFERAADREMAGALHEALGWPVQQSPLWFEGGNVVSDDATVFLGADLVGRNAAELDLAPEAVVRRFEDLLGRPVVVLGPSPQPVPHIDLAVTPLGGRRVLVGDGAWGARIAEQLLETAPDEVARFEEAARAQFFGSPDIESVTLRDGTRLEAPALAGGTRRAAAESRNLAEDLDALADGLAARGFRVARVPLLLPDRSGDSSEGPGYPVLSYDNVVMESESGRDRVYLPRYGLAALDDEAARVWRGLGFEVVPVADLVTSAMYGGSLRCALKVLARAD